MSKSTIEWTDETWNPIAGCSKVSAGCKNCYAERMAKRLVAMGVEKYVGTVDNSGRWTGFINLDWDSLRVPYRWRKPRMVFVNSMSDLFHEGVGLGSIQEVFRTMRETPEHTYQVLTKRPERMRDYVQHREPAGVPRNVWLGVSVEDQAAADARIPALLQTPATVRFLSFEPLLGPVDLCDWYDHKSGDACVHPLDGYVSSDGSYHTWVDNNSRIHWVICGGESGPNARPMHPEWARSLRDQCVGAGVPFFFKQWGGTNKTKAGRTLDGREWNEFPGLDR